MATVRDGTCRVRGVRPSAPRRRTTSGVARAFWWAVPAGIFNVCDVTGRELRPIALSTADRTARVRCLRVASRANSGPFDLFGQADRRRLLQDTSAVFRSSVLLTDDEERQPMLR